MSAFETAVEHSRKLQAKPSDDELLQLYGLYKVATASDFSSAPQPGTFDFTGKYKYNAWKKLVEEGVTPEQAQERYVALVEELKGKHGFEA